MEERTLFSKVRLQDYRYLFFVLADQYQLSRREQDPLLSLLTQFGSRLGPFGAVIRSTPEQADANNAVLVAKNWREHDQVRLADLTNPKVLVIETDFARFDPREDRFAVIDCAWWGGDPAGFGHALNQIEHTISSGSDFFRFWESEGQTLIGTGTGPRRRRGRRPEPGVALRRPIVRRHMHGRSDFRNPERIATLFQALDEARVPLPKFKGGPRLQNPENWQDLLARPNSPRYGQAIQILMRDRFPRN